MPQMIMRFQGMDLNHHEPELEVGWLQQLRASWFRVIQWWVLGGHELYQTQRPEFFH